MAVFCFYAYIYTVVGEKGVGVLRKYSPVSAVY